jgi:hypothetical protein
MLFLFLIYIQCLASDDTYIHLIYDHIDLYRNIQVFVYDLDHLVVLQPMHNQMGMFVMSNQLQSMLQQSQLFRIRGLSPNVYNIGMNLLGQRYMYHAHCRSLGIMLVWMQLQQQLTMQ